MVRALDAEFRQQSIFAHQLNMAWARSPFSVQRGPTHMNTAVWVSCAQLNFK